MDKCTREVRKQSWKNIITQCMQRPEGMTAKRWLDANGISEQSYYYWLKKIRQETYEVTMTSNALPVQPKRNEVTFAEVSFADSAPKHTYELSFRPDITISTDSITIGVSNTVSDTLLNKVFEVIGHARRSNRCYKDCDCLW